MEMNSLIDTLIGLVVVGLGWFLRDMSAEQKRLQVLLNRTREDYMTKVDARADMARMMEAIHRIEDKLDKLVSK